jgi:hypothetical protein
MGRVAYPAVAGALPAADHPFSGVMNAGRKVVFSRTLRTAEWANTTIAASDAAEATDTLGGHTRYKEAEVLRLLHEATQEAGPPC